MFRKNVKYKYLVLRFNTNEKKISFIFIFTPSLSESSKSENFYNQLLMDLPCLCFWAATSTTAAATAIPAIIATGTKGTFLGLFYSHALSIPPPSKSPAADSVFIGAHHLVD